MPIVVNFEFEKVESLHSPLLILILETKGKDDNINFFGKGSEVYCFEIEYI